MDINDSPAASGHPTTPASTGQQLRAAREARGIEPERIAAELHLSPATIVALENDDHQHLPSAVFVAGYIKSYARMLGLDPGPLLHHYRGAPPTEVVAENRAAPARPATTASGAHAWRLAGVLTVLALAAVAGFWWLGRQDAALTTAATTEPNTAAPAASHATPATAARSAAGDNPPNASDPDLDGARAAISAPTAASQPEAARAMDTEPRAPVQPGAQPETAPASESDSEPLTEPTANPPSNAPPAPAARPEPFDDADEDGLIAVLSPVSAINTARAAPAEPANPAAPGTVLMAFNGPCWVDIRDASGRFKLFGEMGRGDRHVLGGEPPYSVILGNATAVDVTVNGKRFDVQSIARGNVARFDLDPRAR